MKECRLLESDEGVDLDWSCWTFIMERATRTNEVDNTPWHSFGLYLQGTKYKITKTLIYQVLQQLRVQGREIKELVSMRNRQKHQFPAVT